MHAILVSVGTDGDIFPYVGLGRELQARGHRVTLVASEHYLALAEAHGFGFRALISQQENEALLGNPDFWHPLKTAKLSADWGVRLVPRQYELLLELVADQQAVLIANPGVFAARMVHEKLGRPLATLMLQPGLIPSVLAPPVMPMCNLPGWPKPFVRLFWRALDALGDRLVSRRLNPLRASLGLRPIRRVFRNWLSEQLVIGMFPEWYGPPQADWPKAIRLVGFPQFDGGQHTEIPAEVRQFCEAGPPPVAVTFGTEMMHGAELFRSLLEVSSRLGTRCLLLTRHRSQLPAELPPSAFACRFAPFQKLFPLCSAVVHHGGIGTTARALAAGLPQLVLPICFDQMDNAARVQRVGAGESVRFKQSRPSAVEAALKRVLLPEAKTRCKSVRRRFESVPEPLAAAADLVETLAESAKS
jgi:rhamnosyltransferase subunit B